MKWILVGTAAVMVGLYFALNQSKAHNPKHVATRGAGIGKNQAFQNVKGFPVGQVASSVASIGSSIFGGTGTHSPVDPSIKSANAMGAPQGSQMVTSYDQIGVSGKAIPDDKTIVTQLDTGGGSIDSGAPAPADVPTVDQADFVTSMD